MKTHWVSMVVAVVISGFSCSNIPEQGLSESDREAIRALEHDYTANWLAGDTLAVMNLLAEEAVIMPAGIRPISGIREIRSFWWPDDGSTTTVERYVTVIDEIAGDGRLAYVRGTGHLEFTYAMDGEMSEHTSDNMFLMVVRKNAEGKWKIWRRMWGGFDPG